MFDRRRTRAPASSGPKELVITKLGVGSDRGNLARFTRRFPLRLSLALANELSGAHPFAYECGMDQAATRGAHERFLSELAAFDILFASTGNSSATCSALVRVWHALLEVERPSGAEPFIPTVAIAAGGEFVHAVVARALGTGDALPKVNALWAHRRALQVAASASQANLSSKAPRWRSVVALVSVGLALAALCAGLWLSRPLWRAQYYRTLDFGDLVMTRNEHSAGGDYGLGPPAAHVPADGFSARWTTCLTLPRATEVVFTVGSDDGSRLLIDGRVTVDSWKRQRYEEREGTAQLEAGSHLLVLEYFDDGGQGVLKFRGSIGTGRSAISSSMLKLPRNGARPCD